MDTSNNRWDVHFQHLFTYPKIFPIYDQFTLNTVSVFKDIGSNAGVFSGLLYAAVSSGPHRYGVPWVVHAIGATEGFVGYFFMWLAIVGFIPRPPLPLMCVVMFLASHSQTFFNTWNVVTAVHNFPHYSGTLVGLMKIGHGKLLIL
ncbi:Protein NUCLEAR FUSION DEFECTIVE 4 [Bienertia sinuspersici]